MRYLSQQLRRSEPSGTSYSNCPGNTDIHILYSHFQPKHFDETEKLLDPQNGFNSQLCLSTASSKKYTDWKFCAGILKYNLSKI